ncbi:rho-associated protein kinase 2 [Trichonephila clavipes]|nr:rho-associated protein kinase 2 [Trichonephila clavipes]
MGLEKTLKEQDIKKCQHGNCSKDHHQYLLLEPKACLHTLVDCMYTAQLKSMDDLQMKELEDQLEAESYFSTLYKTQVKELKEEIDEKIQIILDFENERNNIYHQLQLTAARADSESLARSIAEETIADLEKERTMHELELKDLLSRHRAELSNKDVTISSLKDKESEFKKTVELLTREKDELNLKILTLQEGNFFFS